MKFISGIRHRIFVVQLWVWLPVTACFFAVLSFLSQTIVGRVLALYSRHTYDNPVKICLFQIVKSFYSPSFFPRHRNKNFARLTKLKSIWERWQGRYSISRKLISYAKDPSRFQARPTEIPQSRVLWKCCNKNTPEIQRKMFLWFGAEAMSKLASSIVAISLCSPYFLLIFFMTDHKMFLREF